jgi:hypothetical protein
VDRKKFGKTPDDMKGFEEFIDGEPDGHSFMGKGHPAKKEASFEHFTFLTNDSDRLMKVRQLLVLKIPFIKKYSQGKSLIDNLQEEKLNLSNELFNQCEKKGSAYRKSLLEIFEIYFNPPKK